MELKVSGGKAESNRRDPTLAAQVEVCGKPKHCFMHCTTNRRATARAFQRSDFGGLPRARLAAAWGLLDALDGGLMFSKTSGPSAEKHSPSPFGGVREIVTIQSIRLHSAPRCLLRPTMRRGPWQSATLPTPHNRGCEEGCKEAPGAPGVSRTADQPLGSSSLSGEARGANDQITHQPHFMSIDEID